MRNEVKSRCISGRNSRYYIVAALFIIALATTVSYIGCGGSSSSDSGSSTVAKLNLTGHAGTGYLASYRPTDLFDRFCDLLTPKAYAAAGTTIDKIIAIPYQGGNFDRYCIRDAKESTFTAGAFALSLEKDRNWLLVLVNTAASKYDQFVAYVDLSDGLIQLPASSAIVSALDIGDLNQASSDMAVSSDPISTTDFSMTADQLLKLARNNDMLKIVSNFYLNYDQASGVYYNLAPAFNWRGHYAVIENAYQPITGYTLESYQLSLYTNTATLSVNNLCGNGVTKVQATLVPPAPVNNLAGMVYSPSVPISNASAAPSDIDSAGKLMSNDFFAGGISGEYMALDLGSCNLTGTIPSGLWTWNEDSVLKAQFDVGIAAPITGTDKIKGFIPSLKVNTNPTTHQIISVSLKWYALNNATLDYDEITDLAVLKYLMGNSGGSIFLDAQGGGRYDNVSFSPTSTTIAPTLEWYYGANGDAAKRAGQIGILYTISGVTYSCAWSALSP